VSGNCGRGTETGSFFCSGVQRELAAEGRCMLI
jgi:hypothetical protein